MYLFGSSRFTKTCDPTVFSKMSLLNNETITNGVEKVKNLDDWIDRGSIFNKPSLFQDSVRSFTTSGDLSAKNMNKLMKIFEGRMKSILKEVKFVVKKGHELEYLLGFGILTTRVASAEGIKHFDSWKEDILQAVRLVLLTGRNHWAMVNRLIATRLDENVY